jgi:formylglycine-generating enzyme required for sulfatase activity
MLNRFPPRVLIIALGLACLPFLTETQGLHGQPVPTTQPGGSGPDESLAGPMVQIEPGSFIMGSPESENGRSREETQHAVKLTRPFWIGRHEVTVGQFKKFVRETGYKTDAEKAGRAWRWHDGNATLVDGLSWQAPGFEQTDAHPVVVVSLNDAKAYCDWLSKKLDQTCTLPTEAQWEYACRAGQAGPWSGAKSLEEVGWFRENAGPGTSPVEQKKPNTWGLYDMHGNAMEWTLDRHGAYPSNVKPAVGGEEPMATVTDPTGPETGENFVTRGGSWSARLQACRAASRSKYKPDSASNFSGFRIVVE